MSTGDAPKLVPPVPLRRRILLIDDNEQIHEDFRKTLLRRQTGNDLSADEAALFGGAPVLGQALFTQPLITYVVVLLVPGCAWWLSRTRPGLARRRRRRGGLGLSGRTW